MKVRAVASPRQLANNAIEPTIGAPWFRCNEGDRNAPLAAHCKAVRPLRTRHGISVRLQTKGITDWDSFHLVFAETLGFPGFYGRNMNAWNDCLTYLDDADAGMTTVTVAPGELFHLEVTDSADFQKRLPEIFQAFIECAAFVNWRRAEQGERPVLALVLL